MLKKSDLLEVLCTSKQLDILCIAEHWLQAENAQLMCLPDYKIASSFCRNSRKRGGTMICVRNNYSCKDMPSITSLGLEEVFEISACIVVELKILVVCIYRNEVESNKHHFLDRFEILLNTLTSVNMNIIISADFNIDFNSDNTTTIELCSLIDSFGLNICLSNVITRPGLVNIGSCIDNVITNCNKSDYTC